MVRCIVMMFVWASTLLAAPIPKEIKNVNDHRDILGTWQMVRHSNNGMKPTDVSDVAWVFEENGKAFILHLSTGFRAPMTYSIDPTTEPKRMDWSNGGNRPAIYKLEGDKLITASTMKVNGTRPMEFKDANNVYHTEFRRVSEPKK